jgi:hypothetical protein
LVGTSLTVADAVAEVCLEVVTAVSGATLVVRMTVEVEGAVPLAGSPVGISSAVLFCG